MMTMEELSGNWNDLKGQVKTTWGNISDDELKQVEGNADRLVGLIQKKTGASRAEIEKTIRSWSEASSTMLDSATQALQGATQVAHDYLGQARDMAGEHYGRAQTLVRERPAESVLLSFGAGLLVGVAVGIIIRSK